MRTIAIVSRSLFPNQQSLFDALSGLLKPHDLEIRYGVMLGVERERSWSLGESAVSVRPELIGSGRSIRILDKEVSSPFGVTAWLKKLAPCAVVVTPASEIGNFVALRAARRMGVPAIGLTLGVRERHFGWIDGIRLLASKRIHRAFCKRLDYAFTDGTKAARDVRNLRVLDEGRIVVVRHNIDDRKYWIHSQAERMARSRRFRRAHDLGDSFCFSYVGQLIRRKGVDLLVRGFEAIAPGNPAVKLVIVGRGPLRAECLRLRDAHPGRVLVLDRISDDAMLDFYCASDCVVVPSRFDDWANVISECVCTMTNVISSDGAQAAFDLLDPAAVFESGSLSGLTNAMERAVASSPEPGAPSSRQEAYARDWSLAASAEAWKEALLKVISSPP